MTDEIKGYWRCTKCNFWKDPTRFADIEKKICKECRRREEGENESV